jgi:hypothetical protein
MNHLSETWFIDGNIDFELKKYTLLAYLQKVNSYFHEQKLYPQLSDIIFHYNNIVGFKENKDFLKNQFPKRLTGIQIQKLEILYEEMISDGELMEEIERITLYASQKLKKTIEEGTEIYDFVENKLQITPVGIMPLDITEGYFLLSNGNYGFTKVYHYRLSLFERHDARYRSMSSQFIDEWQRNFVNTYENIKSSLIKLKKELPLPAVYSIETTLKYPFDETLLPIAKRTLVRYISSNA